MKNQMKHNSLNESLLEGDLKWLVDDSVLIDMHKTKLGKNKDYIVLSIAVNDLTPANDLAQFIETSVHDFEDVEVSPATDSKGRYLIYIEIDRGPDAYKSISGILTDTTKLCGIENWKFKSMGMNSYIPFDEESFAAHVITNPNEYEMAHPEADEQESEEPKEAEPEEAESEETAQESVTESIKSRLKFLLNY